MRWTVGGELSAVAGPYGAGGYVETELHKRQAPIFTYLKSRGFYAGVQVDGTVVIERTDENERFYGGRISCTDILVSRTILSDRSQISEIFESHLVGAGHAIIFEDGEGIVHVDAEEISNEMDSLDISTECYLPQSRVSPDFFWGSTWAIPSPSPSGYAVKCGSPEYISQPSANTSQPGWKSATCANKRATHAKGDPESRTRRRSGHFNATIGPSPSRS